MFFSLERLVGRGECGAELTRKKYGDKCFDFERWDID